MLADTKHPTALISCSRVVEMPALRARRAKPSVAAIGVRRCPSSSVKTEPARDRHRH